MEQQQSGCGVSRRGWNGHWCRTWKDCHHRENGGRGFTATREVECSGIALSKTSMTLLVNESESLSFPCYGAASGKNVVWSSSNPSVADAAAGRITGHYPGTATVTAVVYGTGYAASCTVVVEEDVADAVNCTVQSGQFCGFDSLLSTLNSRSREKTGAGLDYLISLSVPTSRASSIMAMFPRMPMDTASAAQRNIIIGQAPAK